MIHYFSELAQLFCLALLVPWTVQVWLSRRRVLQDLQELETMRAGELARHGRLVELSRINAARQFEVQWLTCTSAQESQLDRLFKLLEKSSAPQPLYAWIIDQWGNCLAQNQFARNERVEPAMTHAGLQRLRSWQSGRSLQVKRDFVFSPGADTLPIQELTLYSCSLANPTPTFLCLSRTPATSGDEVADRALMTRLCQQLQVLPDEIRDETLPSEVEELDLIRDMLSLRMVADDHFETPEMMLREFLLKLAHLTNFERVSVYRSKAPEEDCYDLLASGGMPIESGLMGKWGYLEEKLLGSLDVGLQLSSWVPASVLNSPDFMEGDLKFESAIVVGQDSPHGVRTLLVFSGRWSVVQSRIKQDLAKWSVQFLPQVFERSLSRLQIEERARKDGLTRVANRLTFDMELQKGMSCCQAEQSPFSLLMVDLDRFKSINDTYGHLTGDSILRNVAATLVDIVKEEGRLGDSGLVARYGGEEFGILLPQVPLAGAMRIGERIRQSVEQIPHQVDDGILWTTISVGVATMNTHGSTPRELVAAADRALYAAKHAGRNCVQEALVAHASREPQLQNH